ncbi:MAG: Hsp20/alpha crystallin family protein [Acidimicrobiales bacterium]
MNLPISHRNDGRSGRWNPWGELDRVQRELAGLLDAQWNDGFTPLADVEEAPDAYLIEIELPGVSRDQVEIEVSDRHLSVRGERKEKERVGFLRRRERIVGRFSYDLTLPEDLDQDGVEASLTDGVLTVRLPKIQGSTPRRIEIH